MIHATLVALATPMTSTGPLAAQETLDGTWRLVSSMRTNAATGATTGSFGYTTQPAPSALDGTMGFATLVWEKLK